MTNGDVIKAMFSELDVKEKNNGYEVYFGIGTAIQFFNYQWWNAPYKEIEQQPCENITYICDGKKCPECSIQCRHTTDISHAKNFKPVMSTDGETILSYEEDGYFDRLTKVLTKEILAKASLQFNTPTHEEYTERCNHTQSEGAYDE